MEQTVIITYHIAARCGAGEEFLRVGHCECIRLNSGFQISFEPRTAEYRGTHDNISGVNVINNPSQGYIPIVTEYGHILPNARTEFFNFAITNGIIFADTPDSINRSI